MDTNVAGLNKVVCFAPDSTYNGKTVEITDNTNTWTQVIDNLSCVFMIPSMPAPAKKTYTVILYMADNITPLYTRTFELGFGDSIRIGLNERFEIVTKESVPFATSSRVGGFKIIDSQTNGVYVDATGYLKLRTATNSQQGGMRVPSSTSYGVHMSGTDLQTYNASTTQSGCIKIGEGLQVNSSGVASIKPAGSTSSTRGGVYADSTSSIQINSDGQIRVKTGNNLDKTSDGYIYLDGSFGGAETGTLNIDTIYNVDAGYTGVANMYVIPSGTYTKDWFKENRCTGGFLLDSSNNRYGSFVVLSQYPYYTSGQWKIRMHIFYTNESSIQVSFTKAYLYY